MKRRVYLSLVLVLGLLLAGCGQSQTAAEAYLAARGPEEIGEYFARACSFTENYTNPKECSEWDMFRFASLYELDDVAECDENQKYHFTMADLAGIFDRYFVEWEFDPAYFGEDYDPETQEIVTITGFGGDLWDYEFMSAKAVGEDEVEVLLEGSFNRDVPPEESNDPNGLWSYETIYSDNTVRAKIVDGEAKFISWSRQNRE